MTGDKDAVFLLHCKVGPQTSWPQWPTGHSYTDGPAAHWCLWTSTRLWSSVQKRLWDDCAVEVSWPTSNYRTEDKTQQYYSNVTLYTAQTLHPTSSEMCWVFIETVEVDSPEEAEPVGLVSILPDWASTVWRVEGWTRNFHHRQKQLSQPDSLQPKPEPPN